MPGERLRHGRRNRARIHERRHTDATIATAHRPTSGPAAWSAGGTGRLSAHAPGHGRHTLSPQRWISRHTPAISARRQDRRIQHRIRGVAWAGVVLALLVGVLGGGPAGAQPDFTNVTDILYGRRHLLRTDDLVVAYQAGGEVLGNLLLTDTSQITSNTASSLDVLGNLTAPTVTAARMFDTPYDVAVSAVLEVAVFPQVLHWSLDARPNDGSPVQISGSLDLSHIGDFRLPNKCCTRPRPTSRETGTMMSSSLPLIPDAGGAFAFVATAVDPTNPTRGLMAGPLYTFLAQMYNPRPIAIDTSTGTPRVYIAQPVALLQQCDGILGTGLRIDGFTVDPQSLTLSHHSSRGFPVNIPEGSSDPLDDDACLQTLSIDVGRFGSPTRGQLAVAYAVVGGTVKVIPFDVDAQGNLVQMPLYDTGQAVGDGRAWLRSGQFDWTSAFDQAALLISSGQENSLRILSFDQTLTVQSGPVATIDKTLCVGDLAVGNFNRMQANPTPPPDTLPNPNLQLAAFLQPTCGVGTFTVQIWDVSPVATASGQFQVAPHPVYTFSAPSTGAVPFQSMAVAAADLQGRSLRLGAPTKATIASRSQPVVVTGVPPMHVDFVTPVGRSTPQVLNVSVVPDGFYAQYDTTNQTSVQSSSQHTTSWSVGTKEDASFSWGVGDAAAGEGFDNTTQFAAEQAWNGNVQSTTDYGSAEAFNASIHTRFADYVRYHEARMNLYIYPVLGKTACPADQVTGTPPNTSCTVPEVPLTVQFSAPDQASLQNVDGTSLEWYQPPWQPGNILSYPGNQEPVAGAPPRPGPVVPGRDLSDGRACGHGKHHLECAVGHEHHREHLLQLLLRSVQFSHGRLGHRGVLREGESHP